MWPLINCLCIFTAVLSSFLDNVTTVLLMTPVSIRLCEVMGLNPVPILMAMIIYSNVGGALTPGNKFTSFFLSKNVTICFSIFKQLVILQMLSLHRMPTLSKE